MGGNAGGWICGCKGCGTHNYKSRAECRKPGCKGKRPSHIAGKQFPDGNGKQGNDVQAKLDKQKQEDMLVEKLLKREQEEMKQAYIDARVRKCKAMQVENRRLKAETTGEKRQKQMKEIEEQRIAEVKANEGARAAQIEQ